MENGTWCLRQHTPQLTLYISPATKAPWVSVLSFASFCLIWSNMTATCPDVCEHNINENMEHFLPGQITSVEYDDNLYI